VISLRAGQVALAVFYLTLPARADELVDTIRRNFIPSTFDSSTVSDDARIYFVADGKGLIFGKEQLVDIVEKIKQSNVTFNLDEFEVTNRVTTGGISAISYTADVHERSEGREKLLRYTCHDIWLNTDGHFSILFGASEEKILIDQK